MSVVADFSGGNGWGPGAFTTTDAEGRYLLCNMRDVGLSGVGMVFNKAGWVDASGTAWPFFFLRSPLDVELRRQ